MYLPSAAAYRRRIADGARLAFELCSWEKNLAESWSDLRFGRLQASREGDSWAFEVQVHLPKMDPEMIKVELYADTKPIDGASPVRVVMNRKGSVEGTDNKFQYECRVAGGRPSGDFTPRIIPYHPEASVPMEASHILWHH